MAGMANGCPSRIMINWGVAISIALASGGASAQMFKCTNAAGKVTYSGQKCSGLGLKDAGEVKERIQAAPGDRPAAEAGARRPAPAPAPANAPAKDAEPPPPAAKADDADRRCFSVKTAKGTSMRYGDKPEE